MINKMTVADSIAVDVVPIQQPIGKFYVGKMRSDDLLKICQFDFRRMRYTSSYIEFMGIQRKISDKRIQQIVKFVKTVDACFPTSIVISVDEKCVTSNDEHTRMFISNYDDPVDPTLSIALDQAATIIDGQHRLKGLADSGTVFELAVTLFVGVDVAIEAMLFSKVNLAQTKVNKSLAYDLFEIAHERSPEKSCHLIVVALDKSAASPFQGMIKRLGVATDGRFGETLSQATIVKGILPYISNDPVGDRDRGKRFGF